MSKVCDHYVGLAAFLDDSFQLVGGVCREGTAVSGENCLALLVIDLLEAGYETGSLSSFAGASAFRPSTMLFEKAHIQYGIPPGSFGQRPDVAW